MHSILVELPFVYQARIFAPRRRTPEIVPVTGRVATRIAVADPAEMPVAFRGLEGRLSSQEPGTPESRRELAEHGVEIR